MQRGSWIISGGVVLAAVIVAAVLFATSGRGSGREGTSPEHPLSADERFVQRQLMAQEREAQALLRTALVTAKTHYATGLTYAGFDSLLAKRIEPGIVWYENTTAMQGTVTINLATDGDVVLSTAAAGGVLCIAEHDEGATAGTYYGRMDGYEATSAAACAGGW